MSGSTTSFVFLERGGPTEPLLHATGTSRHCWQPLRQFKDTGTIGDGIDYASIDPLKAETSPKTRCSTTPVVEVRGLPKTLPRIAGVLQKQSKSGTCQYSALSCTEKENAAILPRVDEFMSRNRKYSSFALTDSLSARPGIM